MRKKPVEKEEHKIQSAFVKWVSWQIKNYPELDLLMAFCNERLGGWGEINYFMAEGLKPGAPDLFLSVARGKYHGLYLETKTPKGSLSPNQRRMKKLLVAQDYKVVVYKDVEKGKQIILEYLGLLDKKEKQD